MTVVQTLKATGIVHGATFFCAEAGHVKMHNGDLVHAVPALAAALLTLYPRNLVVETDYHEDPLTTAEARCRVEAKGETPAKKGGVAPADADHSIDGVFAMHASEPTTIKPKPAPAPAPKPAEPTPGTPEPDLPKAAEPAPAGPAPAPSQGRRGKPRGPSAPV